MTLLALALVLGQYTNPYTGVTWNNPMSNTLDTAIYNSMWKRATMRGLGLTPPGTVQDVPNAPPRAAYTATDFKPAGPRSVAQALVAQSKGVTKEQARALVEGLNAGIDSFEKEARKNNVAYALAFLLGVSVQVLSEKDVPDDKAEELAQLINDELAASASFKKTTPKQRQIVYETSIVTGALIGGMAAQAAQANDAEMKRQAQAMAAQALATFQQGK
jgi:hypothetical protein